MNPLLGTITSDDPAVRDRAFNALAAGMSTDDLLAACRELDTFAARAENLYQRVRAYTFLYAAFRFHLQESPAIAAEGYIPEAPYRDLLDRRFAQAVRGFSGGPADGALTGALCSARAETYRALLFHTLAEQVRRSVRATRGNAWMFRGGHVEDHGVRLHPALLTREPGAPFYPILCEETPVRLDLTHSGWSDIFFLGMDYPQGARVLNISVDLAAHGRGTPAPPIRACVRAIPEPVLRLVSLDLGQAKDIRDPADLFNFGNDYLSLLKAGVIASGLVPPAFEASDAPLADILARVVGPGMGLELVTEVADIPKGSRLAVSTNLLAAIISVLMRATGQTAALDGPLSESERRLVAARAILGEWLGGSGGGWQDSGGLWPGIKVIEGVPAEPGDPEWGVSAGRLLPRHTVLGPDDLHPEIGERLARSLIVVHGGLAQHVGPVLEAVTERYLLRDADAWRARRELVDRFAAMRAALKTGDIRALADCAQRNWDGPLKTIIPWVTNAFTEAVTARVRAHAGARFWGFQMLGGMSGGGMGLYVDPESREALLPDVLAIMSEAKAALSAALPFAIDPLIYDVRINWRGTWASWRRGHEALMPPAYYALVTPGLVRGGPNAAPPHRRAEIDAYTAGCGDDDEARRMLRTMVTGLFGATEADPRGERARWDAEAARLEAAHGFDHAAHEQTRADLREGRISLAANRLPAETDIVDVREDDVTRLAACDAHRARGDAALRDGRVAVLTLAGGMGTRWTRGAGVIKALNPFVELGGAHRSFLDIHLAKTEAARDQYGADLPHVITTSYLTHPAIQQSLSKTQNPKSKMLSPGLSIARRLVPMTRDLRFLWETMPEERLDEQAQKVREATRGALLDWARTMGEGSDYTDNAPAQRVHPPGHLYEVANLLRNGTLARLLAEHPRLDTLLLHNVDTVGVSLDPAALGHHLASGNALTVEVIPRRVQDIGGGLARVNGRVRLVEGLALPRELDALRLRFYNSMTTWIAIDPLLAIFGLDRAALAAASPQAIADAVRRVAARIPTYVTIKDVTRRWGPGQQDVYPVAQCEKLWGDMTALPDLPCGYLVVPRGRGQQLKDPADLDPWAREGHAAALERIFASRTART